MQHSFFSILFSVKNFNKKATITHQLDLNFRCNHITISSFNVLTMKNLSAIFACFCCLFAAQSASAQFYTEHLPRNLTPKERNLWPDYIQQHRNKALNSIVQPPASPIRTPAEWEETQGLLVTWTSYPSILREIVRYAREECTVYIVTTNTTSVQNYLTAGGVSLDNIVFLNESYNSIWMRDYGPWSVYTNDVDSLAIVDWIYNRPRPADDVIPAAVAGYFNLPFYEMTAPPYELVHTGGNYMVDGLGTAFSSKLILDENPDLTTAQIDTLMSNYMGIDRYVKMETLPYDGIHHIDMHLKLLDEETLLIGQYPEGISDGPQIEANLNYVLNNYLTPFGNPYKVVRVPMPPDAGGDFPNSGGDYRTYTNSVFVNKTLLVPIYEEQYDTTALRIIQEQLPGYRVQGIDCNEIIPASGAIHCITKLVHTSDPLFIAHPRLRDTYFVEDRTVYARIQHRSGIASATLYWTTSLTDPPTPYQTTMTLTDPINNIWSAVIPAQDAGAVVQYYIEAISNSGKTQVRPITAPEGMYSYRVIEVNAPPTAAFTSSATEVCTSEPIQFNDVSTYGITQWQWAFEGGIPAMSTAPSPTVTFPTAGTHSVSLTVTNAVGTATSTQTIVSYNLTGNTPFVENFEGGIGDTWQINNLNEDNYTWELAQDIDCADNALAVNNFDNSATGNRDRLTAVFDLSGLSNCTLSFRVAYAPYSNTYFDRLQVNIQTCGGSPQLLYDKSGTTLATAPATGDATFVPNGCSQWRTETIDLSAFDGQTVQISLENINGYGNYLYLDDIGVSGVATEPLTIRAKLWLEGAYSNNGGTNSGQLSNYLATNNILPYSQPFNRPPWMYAGIENISTIPTNACDWVLFELRNADNPSNIVAQKAVLLYTDGTLHDADNLNNPADGINLSGIVAGNYYLAIKHRNHLGVMSAAPVVLPNSEAIYDFTASAAAAFHSSQLKPLASNVFVLPAGDCNGNGVHTVLDFNRYQLQFGISGYTDGDLNFDGNVTNEDYIIYENNTSRFNIPVLRDE